MIPAQLQQMFGLKDQKDLNMANNIWKMLDEMAESDPDQYKKFVQKNVKEGIDDVKQKQEEKDKPYKVKPMVGFSLTMNGILNEKPLEANLNQKVLITKLPWTEVKKKFPSNLKIIFNVAYSERIKESKSKSTGKVVEKYQLKHLKDLQLFYYSMQGPVLSKDKQQADFCMIVSRKFYEDLLNQNGGKKVLMGLSISYLQERLSLDKNPLLTQYNPEEFRKLAFYNIDKFSIQINEKPFLYNEQHEPTEFLLQKEIDKKRELEQNQSKKEKSEANQKIAKKQQIKFKQQKVQEKQLPNISLVQQVQNQPKKILIEVLKEEENLDDKISYTMKENQQGYTFQFLLPGIASIKEVDLQMKCDCIRLSTKGKSQLQITLKRQINQDLVKAKFKKAESTLRLETKFK